MASLLSAQTPPDPGGVSTREIQRQEEIERQRRQTMEDQRPDVSIPAPAVPEGELAWPEHEASCQVIREIVLKGRDADKFQWALKAVAEAKGRCLGAQGLNVLMARVQNRIVEEGYVTTRIVAAPQDLTTGRLTLTVIPGRIGGIKLAPGSGRHIVLDTALPLSTGDILNLRDVEQGLENLKRVPTAEADFQLVPGDAEGESVILVSWKQGRPFRLSFSVDDSGSEYTGKYLGNTTLSLDNVLAFSDLFYATVGTNLEHDVPYGNKSRSFYYSLPVGYWEFTVTSSSYTYHQKVAGYLTDYVYSGKNRQTNLEAARVIQRGARSKTTVRFAGFVNESRNYIDDTEIEVQHRRMGGWEAGIGHRRYLGALTLDADVTYHRGTGAFGAQAAPEEAIDEGTSRPAILYLNVRGQYPFQLAGENFRYIGQWRQQQAFDKLVARDGFSIGGRYTVRGYDGDMTLSADNGWVFRNELGWAWGDSGQEMYAGLDYGHVWGPRDEYLLGQTLGGATLGLRGAFKGFNYDLFASAPVRRPKNFPGEEMLTGFSVIWNF
jgi:hemolysin activation/secretion protein